ncbi:hypothetical protein TNCV_3216771 [Trichonephila clavipes]|nr:hypothetical protein TNCV_3216771 [Trichonephila clavipes]
MKCDCIYWCTTNVDFQNCQLRHWNGKAYLYMENNPCSIRPLLPAPKENLLCPSGSQARPFALNQELRTGIEQKTEKKNPVISVGMKTKIELEKNICLFQFDVSSVILLP